MAPELDELVARLEERAQGLHKLLPLAPRAFVIEFAGTPKSGKSTSVEAIRHFFSRQGFTIHVLVERASVCPIPMKGHLFFNTWCAATMLAELLANVDTATDLIIVDRGLFDALVWLTLQRNRGELTPDEARTIESFLLLERWRKLIDLAVVMNVSPEEAIRRENAARISPRPGSIMNPEVLGAITKSVGDTARQYKPYFPAMILHETSGHSVRELNVHLANEIINCFETFLNPNILVVPKHELAKLPLQEGGAFSEESRTLLFDCLLNHATFMPRADAEADQEQVQIIPCGLLVHRRQVFVFERRERDPKYILYGKRTIWQGCHVAQVPGLSGEALLKGALLERITRALFLSRLFPLSYIGYCWDPANESSNRHFGIMFQVTIDNDHTVADLRKKEFRTGRGHDLAGGFTNVEDLGSDQLRQELEAWSIAVLNGTGNLQTLRRAQ